jgi:hypothetical protein
MNARRARSAFIRAPTSRRRDLTLVLSRPSLLSRKDFPSFAIQDAQSDRLRRPLGVCGGYDCGGRVCRLNLFLGQICWATIVRRANKLDPEYLGPVRGDAHRLGACIKFQKRRAGCGVEGGAPGSPTGNNRCNASPVSRGSGAIRLSFPSARFPASLDAKLTHEHARRSVYPLNPFQLPEQPCKHVRLPCPDAGASNSRWRRSGIPPRRIRPLRQPRRQPSLSVRHILATPHPLPNGTFNIQPSPLPEN